jgi:hypothetical protein
VKGRWGKTFARFIIFGIAFFIIYIPVVILTVIMSTVLSSSAAYILEAVVFSIGSMIGVIFTYLLFITYEKRDQVAVSLTPTEAPAQESGV